MKQVLTFFLLLSSASTYLQDSDTISESEYKFMNYITKFNKIYKTVAEYKLRLALYEKRIGEHEIHNSQEGVTSY
jgi:hypothetical protein